MEFLAKKYSLTLPDLRRPLNQEQLDLEKQNLHLYKIMNTAAQLYKQNLQLKENKSAL
jgi:DNA primase